MDTLESLNLQLAFGAWAQPRFYDMTTGADGKYTNLETHAAWLGYEAAHGEDGCKPSGQQLYARIKKSSEYAHQSDDLFPVRVSEAPYDNYVVRGGPGGVYRLSDVNFYVMVDSKAMRLG